jgi:hypothetical protein
VPERRDPRRHVAGGAAERKARPLGI